MAGKVECVFDPFDLTVLEIFWNGSPYGTAVPRVIGRHSHPKAKPEEPGTPPPGATGIDYLAIIAAEHAEAVCRPPFFLSVKSAPGVVAGESHLRRGGAGRATTP